MRFLIPNKNQKLILHSDSPYNLVSGEYASGKSILCSIQALYYIIHPNNHVIYFVNAKYEADKIVDLIKYYAPMSHKIKVELSSKYIITNEKSGSTVEFISVMSTSYIIGTKHTNIIIADLLEYPNKKFDICGSINFYCSIYNIKSYTICVGNADMKSLKKLSKKMCFEPKPFFLPTLSEFKG